MDDIPLKRCTKCGEEKPATDEFFYRDKYAIDNLTTQCKICRSQDGKKWWSENPEKSREYERNRPKRSKEYERERSRRRAKDPKHKEYHSEYRRMHADEASEYNKQYQRANAERIAEYRKARIETARERYREYDKEHAEEKAEYRKERRNNPDSRPEVLALDRIQSQNRRARIKGLPGYCTPQDIQNIFDRQKGKCANPKCKKKLTEYEIDHIQPVTKRDGSINELSSNWPYNLQLLCPSCNRSKHNKSPHEFYGDNQMRLV